MSKAMKTASVLAFERNLDISDAFFSQTSSIQEQSIKPVVVQEKSVRGTISNRLKNAVASDPAKLDAEIEKPNLQRVDSCALSEDCDTLIVTWSCKVLPFTGRPSVCNDQDYQQKLQQTVSTYLSADGMGELAKRYAFDADSEDLKQLANWIEQGLTGQAFIILNIQAKAVVGFGQEVFPSQELVLDTGKTKSKVLYEVNGKASMHSQKVSNAIRTIDDWYPGAEFPIAVEPYGAVTTLGKAFRQPKQKMDFYSIFDNWVLKDEEPTTEQRHYAISVLIRGGVFGASGKE